MPRLIVTFALAFAAAVAAPAAQTFTSGPKPVALLELFTSEGCSSCPPAERWLAGLRAAPELWREVVPVAWHVTYWDSLGWKDAYAAKAFTARQYAYASLWHSDSVYTPCLARNGREWHLGEAAAQMAGDAGKLTVTWAGHGQCQVDYTAPAGAPPGAYVVTVVLLGGGLTCEVQAGENAGRMLGHEFVAWQTARADLTTDRTGHHTATVRLPADNRPLPPIRALAAWITVGGALAPVQATGGWLD
ncbi:MAG: DUF1223 domain-containing protein [Opitutales bacterium]